MVNANIESSNDQKGSEGEISELLNKLEIGRKKPVINIIFIGHVDAGKSTICGRILVDLKMVDSRTLEKYKLESAEKNRSNWYLSWCMDLNPEEREKGKTHELGISNSLELKNVVVNILDAPGHKAYIESMIDGASRADIGVLVVSARINEFESGFRGGSTKEHVRLLKGCNCSSLVVLVNKMDECNWDAGRFGEIETKLRKFLHVVFKKDEIQIIPVSGFLGDNILHKKSLDFYSGPTFLQYLDSNHQNINQQNHSNEDIGVISILTVVEKMKSAGSTSISVKVDQGTIFKNEEYSILPLLNKSDRISQIFTEDDLEAEEIIEKNIYKIKLGKLGDLIYPGYKLIYSSPSSSPTLAHPYKVTKNITAEIGIYDVVSALTVGYSFVFHCNLQVTMGKISMLYNLSTRKPIKVIRKGEKAIAKIELEKPVVVQCHKNKKDMFSIRDEALTVGIGQILKVVNEQQ